MATTSSRMIYNSPRWRAVRREVLERDQYRCQECGRPGRLEVHHRVRLADGGDAFSLDALITLCRPCHFAHIPVDPERRAWRLRLRQLEVESA